MSKSFLLNILNPLFCLIKIKLFQPIIRGLVAEGWVRTKYLLENFDQLVKLYPKIKYYFTLQNEVKQIVSSHDYFESYYSIGKILGSNLKKKRSFFRSLNAMGLI